MFSHSTKSTEYLASCKAIIDILETLRPDCGYGDANPNQGENISARDLASFGQIRTFLMRYNQPELLAEVNMREMPWSGLSSRSILGVYSWLYVNLQRSYQDAYTFQFAKLILDGLANHPSYPDLIDKILTHLSRSFIVGEVGFISPIKAILDYPAFQPTNGILIDIFVIAYANTQPLYEINKNRAPYALELIDLIINYGNNCMQSFNLERMLTRAENLFAQNPKLNANIITKIKEAQTLNRKNNPYWRGHLGTTSPTENTALAAASETHTATPMDSTPSAVAPGFRR